MRLNGKLAWFNSAVPYPVSLHRRRRKDFGLSSFGQWKNSEQLSDVCWKQISKQTNKTNKQTHKYVKITKYTEVSPTWGTNLILKPLIQTLFLKYIHSEVSCLQALQYYYDANVPTVIWRDRFVQGTRSLAGSLFNNKRWRQTKHRYIPYKNTCERVWQDLTDNTNNYSTTTMLIYVVYLWKQTFRQA